jgi:hypothetical protein
LVASCSAGKLLASAVALSWKLFSFFFTFLVLKHLKTAIHWFYLAWCAR